MICNWTLNDFVFTARKAARRRGRYRVPVALRLRDWQPLETILMTPRPSYWDRLLIGRLKANPPNRPIAKFVDQNVGSFVHVDDAVLA